MPTPFAIRTALLDAAIRTQGIASGPPTFDTLKAITVAVYPPKQVAVTNLFAKVQKPARHDKKKGEEEDDTAKDKAMTRTIAFREYAHLWGNLGIAFSCEQAGLGVVRALLPQVNYFGKRGGFFQLLDAPQEVHELPEGFYLLDGAGLPGIGVGTLPAAFPLGVIQVMDDWGPELDWEKVNVYTQAKIKLGEDRTRKSVILPYRLARSSKSFTLYERMT